MIAHPQPFLTNQMTMSTHQPINIGIAHVVWPQPAANKRAKPCVNRYDRRASPLAKQNTHAPTQTSFPLSEGALSVYLTGAATSLKQPTSKI